MSFHIFIAIIVTVIIAVLQIIFFQRTRKSISIFQEIFPNDIPSEIKIKKQSFNLSPIIRNEVDDENYLIYYCGLPTEDYFDTNEMMSKAQIKDSSVHNIIFKIRLGDRQYDFFPLTNGLITIDEFDKLCKFCKIKNQVEISEEISGFKIKFIDKGILSKSDETTYTVEKPATIELIEYDSSSNVIDMIEVVSHTNPYLEEITLDINDYLIKNKGNAADFNIIKDITERNLANLENEILATISRPLYIGLMGTFLGVMLGFLPILFGDSFDENFVKNFISGVVVAMVGSFLGLLLTTINNSKIYKDALKDLEKNKNDFYTLIQKELLPILSNDMASSLVTLKSNLNRFNEEFGNNVLNFKEGLKDIQKNIETQKEIFDLISKTKYQELAQNTIEMYNTLKNSKDDLAIFNNYIQTVTKTVNEAVEAAKVINDLFKRFTSLEEGLNKFTETVSKQNYSFNLWVEQLQKELNEINNRKDVLLQTLETSDKNIIDFIEYQSKILKDITNLFTQQIEDIQKHILQDLENKKEKFAEVMKTSGSEFDTFINAIFGSMDKNNIFKKLNLLEDIKNEMKNINTALTKQKMNDKISKKDEEFIKTLNNINQNLLELNNSLNHSILHPFKWIKAIFKKLWADTSQQEENLSQNNNKINKPNNN